MMKKYLKTGLTLALLAMLPALLSAQSIQLHVSPNGNDDGAGTRQAPFLTLEKALSSALKLKKIPGQWIDTTFIYLQEGHYPALEPITIGQEYSGLPGAPLVIAPAPGQRASIQGGTVVSPQHAALVTDRKLLRRMLPEARGKVYRIDLKAAGIGSLEPINSSGLNVARRAKPQELYFNDRLMQVARWPNEGYDTYGKVVDEGSIPRYYKMTIAPGGVPVDPNNPPPQFAKYLNDSTQRPGIIRYTNPRTERWTEAEDLWMFGWWRHSWASQSLKVAGIDTQKKEITFAQPHHYGLGDDNIYYAFNLLEEIDLPGEYMIDRNSGVMYFWPPEPIETARIVLSIATQPLVVLEGTSHVILRGLTVETGRGSGIIINGGTHNRVENCLVRNLGDGGIVIRENESDRSRFNGIVDCELTGIGGYAITIGGGDRATLDPAGNYAVNNHLHDRAEISLTGTGNRIAHNLIHDNPHHAITYSGNDHLIEYNDISHCLQDADDAGCIYTGRNPSCQGTVIRYNYIHHTKGIFPKGIGTAGIYLDDGAVGQVIYGNIFYEAGNPKTNKFGAIFIHGGKDNIIMNNIFAECAIGVGFSTWPQDRWNAFLVTGDMKTRLYEETDIRTAPYSNRYPNLARLPENASQNRIERNAFIRVGMATGFSHDRVMPQIFTGNWESDMPVTADELIRKVPAQVFQNLPDFQPIPTGRIGLEKK